MTCGLTRSQLNSPHLCRIKQKNELFKNEELKNIRKVYKLKLYVYK